MHRRIFFFHRSPVKILVFFLRPTANFFVLRLKEVINVNFYVELVQNFIFHQCKSHVRSEMNWRMELLIESDRKQCLLSCDKTLSAHVSDFSHLSHN